MLPPEPLCAPNKRTKTAENVDRSGVVRFKYEYSTDQKQDVQS